jgi:hypothetical protein
VFTYGLHGAIFQKLATFITTAVTTLNPKIKVSFLVVTLCSLAKVCQTIWRITWTRNKFNKCKHQAEYTYSTRQSNASSRQSAHIPQDSQMQASGRVHIFHKTVKCNHQAGCTYSTRQSNASSRQSVHNPQDCKFYYTAIRGSYLM